MLTNVYNKVNYQTNVTLLCREREASEEIQLAARLKVTMDIEREDQQVVDDAWQRDEQQRRLQERLHQLELRQAANNLKVSCMFFCSIFILQTVVKSTCKKMFTL